MSIPLKVIGGFALSVVVEIPILLLSGCPIRIHRRFANEQPV
jgi:hypothetical protein